MEEFTGVTALWVSAILGIWSWIFKSFVIERLQEAIDALTKTIDEEQQRSNELMLRCARLDERIHNLEVRIKEYHNNG